MASIGWITGLLGLALLAAGLALLVLAWRRKRQTRGALITGGWALIAAAMLPWAVSGGPDRGPAIAITMLSLVAIGVVMRNGAAFQRATSPAADDAEADARAAPPARIPWLRRTWVVLLAGPVAFASSVALGLVAFRGGPGTDADRLALSAFLVPIAWGALATWAASDPKLLRKTLGVIGTGAAGAAIVAMMIAA